MYYIKINDVLYKLKTHSVPIHFIHDIGVHNDSRGSISVSKVILNDDINDVLSVELLICGNVYKLGKPLLVHRKHNLYTMYFEVENVFESYKEFISRFDNDRFSSILTSFSTVDLCNLKCYYCSNSMNKHQDSRQHDLYLSQIFISKIHNIVRSVLGDKFCAKYHCYMGGEPFIDRDMFFEYVKFFFLRILSLILEIR